MTESNQTVERSFVVVDLVGYTALTDTHGDDLAVELHIVALGADRGEPSLDPVCHMIANDSRRVVTLRWKDHTIGFCSEDCAERFAANPEHYEDHVGDC